MCKRVVVFGASCAMCLLLAACGTAASSATPAVASSVPAASSQVVSSMAQPVSSVASSSRMLDGGYTKPRELTEEDAALFGSVMGALDNGKTYEPVTVATQVVAGTNYRFSVKVTENGTTTDSVVVIFQPLPGQGEAELVSEAS